MNPSPDLCNRAISTPTIRGLSRIERIRVAVALQGAEVIRATKLGSQLLEDAPIMLRAVGTHFAFKVGDDAVVVEQRVVHVE